MEFWAQNQGQTPQYPKFGTVPGRNCAHAYHDKHRPTHFQPYLCEQQQQHQQPGGPGTRDPGSWTVPGSRTGGVLQDYTNWSDHPETTTTTTAVSSHFPFILDSQPRQPPQHFAEYPPHENRERGEWLTAGVAGTHSHQTVRERDYDRAGVPGWPQRRWESCSPVHYRQEASSRRSDSSYRELEAWAARYSHSLPRRRHVGAGEQKRASSSSLQGASSSSENHNAAALERSSRMAALHQAVNNAREFGLGHQWDRGGAGQRQQQQQQYSVAHHLPVVPNTTYNTSNAQQELQAGYQRRMFSQPPGYVAPPPYNNSPSHKDSPEVSRYDGLSTTSWAQEGSNNRQTYCSQLSPRQQDRSVDLKGAREGELEGTVLEQRTAGLDSEDLKYQIRQETDGLWSSPPAPDSVTSVQQQPIEHEALEVKPNEDLISPTVAEGRKFKSNKRRGGQTIFCLVSRMCDTSGSSNPSPETLKTTSLPQNCNSPASTNIQSTGLREVSGGPKDSGDIDLQTHKLADEVDCSVQSLEVGSSTPSRHFTQPTDRNLSVERDDLQGVNRLSNTIETEVAFNEKDNMDDTIAFWRQKALPPTSVKYPLWREPGYTDRVKAETPPPLLKANVKEGKLGVADREDSANVSGHPIDIEVRRLEIQRDTESESSGGFLVIDTTCVIVRMELIPAPKKEHVHYLSSIPCGESSQSDVDSPATAETYSRSNNHQNEDGAQEISAHTSSLKTDERPDDTDSGSVKDKIHQVSNVDDVMEEAEVLLQQTEEVSDFSFSSSGLLPSLPNRESLEERAERILGIPLTSCIGDDHDPTEDPTSFRDSCAAEDQNEKMTRMTGQDGINDDNECLSRDVTGESQQQLDFGPDEEDSSVVEVDAAECHLSKEDEGDLVVGRNDDETLQIVNDDEVDSVHERPSKDVAQQQPSECGRVEEAVDVKESSVTECELPEDEEDLTGVLEQTSGVSGENDPEIEVKSLQESKITSELLSESCGQEEQREEDKNQHYDNGIFTQSPSERVQPHSDLHEVCSRLPADSPDCTMSPSAGGDVLLPTSELTSVSDTCESHTAADPQEELTALSSTADPCLHPETLSDITETSLFTQMEPQTTTFPDLATLLGSESLPVSQPGSVSPAGPPPESPRECLDLSGGTEDAMCFLDLCIKGESYVDETMTEEPESQQQSSECDPVEEAVDVKESNVTEYQLPEDEEDRTGVLEQTSMCHVSNENAIECQLEIEVNYLQGSKITSESLCESQEDKDLLEKSPSECVQHPPSDHYSHPQPSDSPDSTMTPSAAGDVMLPTSPSCFPQTSFLHFSSSLFSAESNTVVSHLCVTSPQGPSYLPSPQSLDSAGDFCRPPTAESTQEEPQYPMSLWDAVNRIRKHTAPDSENDEEEELSELWDPDRSSVGGEDVSTLDDLEVDFKSEEDMLFHYSEGLKEAIMSFEEQHNNNTVVVQLEQGPSEERGDTVTTTGQIEEEAKEGNEESCGYFEEDTLSCSSGDTVVVGDEEGEEAAVQVSGDAQAEETEHIKVEAKVDKVFTFFT